MVITNTQTRRLIPLSLMYDRLPQSTWACSPGAVSNRIVASGCRHWRFGLTYCTTVE